MTPKPVMKRHKDVLCERLSVREALNKLIPLMVRQAHHYGINNLPFVLSLSKDLFSVSLAQP